MRISYGITVCNELDEITTLLKYLTSYMSEIDEIVILLDKSKSTFQIETVLYGYAHNNEHIRIVEDYFNNNFAEWKNKLINACTGDYIFSIDADEYPDEYLIQNLRTVLQQNSSVDLFIVPRINTVEGLTADHVTKWRWSVNENGYVNFPDWQGRIFRNTNTIRWHNKVHETIQGTNTYAYLPTESHWCLYHPKTIERQERQNSLYDSL